MNMKITNRMFNIATTLVVLAIAFFLFCIVQKETTAIEVKETVEIDDDVTDNPLEDTDSLTWNIDSLVSPDNENPIVETAKKQSSTIGRYSGKLVDLD